MDEKLRQKIDMNEKQREELERWCKIIGDAKYFEYAKVLESDYPIPEKIPFDVLRECVIYDSKLNYVLFSVLRYVEFGLENEVGKIHSKKPMTLRRLIDKANVKRGNEGHMITPKQQWWLNDLRNMVMHHELFIGRKDTKDKIINALRFIADDDLRKKKIDEINALIKYDEKGKEKEILLYQIKIAEGDV